MHNSIKHPDDSISNLASPVDAARDMVHPFYFADGPSAKFCGWETGFPPKYYYQMGVDGTNKPFDPFQHINMKIGIQIPE